MAPLLVDDVLLAIFSSEELSPRDKVNISCASKHFQWLARSALLSEIIWSTSKSVGDTVTAWSTIYANDTKLVKRIDVNLTSIIEEVRYPQLYEDTVDTTMLIGHERVRNFVSQLTALESLLIELYPGFPTPKWMDYLLRNGSSPREIKIYEGSLTFVEHYFLLSLPDLDGHDAFEEDPFHAWDKVESMGLSNSFYPADKTLNPFLTIPAIRHLTLCLSYSSTYDLLDQDLSCLRNLDSLHLTTTRDSLTYDILGFLENMREDALLDFSASLGHPFSKEDQSHKFSIRGQVGLAMHVLPRCNIEYCPLTIDICQPQIGGGIDVYIEEREERVTTHEDHDNSPLYTSDIRLRLQRLALTEYGKVRTVHILSKSTIDIDLLLGISEAIPDLEILKIEQVESKAPAELFFRRLGVDFLPRVQSLKTLHIPYTQLLGFEDYIEPCVVAWSNLFPSLEDIKLVPGMRWIRKSNLWVVQHDNP